MLLFSLRAFALSFRSCPTLCDPVDGSPAGASDHGVLQARILEWVAMPSPGDLPNPGITLDNCKVFSPTSHSPVHCSSLLKAMIFYSSWLLLPSPVLTSMLSSFLSIFPLPTCPTGFLFLVRIQLKYYCHQKTIPFTSDMVWKFRSSRD